jgi:DNA-binding LytR/AlgR family response regulator
MLIGAKISMLLTNLGYEVTGILPRGEDAIVQVEENRPDIVVLDINLKGQIDGIETAAILQQKNIPVIYLTANSDDATFNRAKLTRPTAFISKPFKQLDLQRAVELTIIHLAHTDPLAVTPTEVEEEQPFILADRIFVRYTGKMVKIMLMDILYIEAHRNYSRIFTSQKEFLLSVTLKYIEEKLKIPFFMRIHRSYLVNLTRIEQVFESDVMIGTKAIPLGAGMRERLLERMQTI